MSSPTGGEQGVVGSQQPRARRDRDTDVTGIERDVGTVERPRLQVGVVDPENLVRIA
jgi:hypothetical protein